MQVGLGHQQLTHQCLLPCLNDPPAPNSAYMDCISSYNGPWFSPWEKRPKHSLFCYPYAYTYSKECWKIVKKATKKEEGKTYIINLSFVSKCHSTYCFYYVKITMLKYMLDSIFCLWMLLYMSVLLC